MNYSICVRNLNSEFSFMRAIILQSYINKVNTWIIQVDYKSCKYSTSEIQRRPSDRPTTFCMKFDPNEFEPNEINFILNSARIIPGRNVFNCQFTSSMYSGVQRAVQIEQWCISCGMYTTISTMYEKPAKMFLHLTSSTIIQIFLAFCFRILDFQWLMQCNFLFQVLMSVLTYLTFLVQIKLDEPFA